MQVILPEPDWPTMATTNFAFFYFHGDVVGGFYRGKRPSGNTWQTVSNCITRALIPSLPIRKIIMPRRYRVIVAASLKRTELKSMVSPGCR